MLTYKWKMGQHINRQGKPTGTGTFHALVTLGVNGTEFVACTHRVKVMDIPKDKREIYGDPLQEQFKCARCKKWFDVRDVPRTQEVQDARAE